MIFLLPDWTVNAPAQTVGEAALADADYARRTVEAVPENYSYVKDYKSDNAQDFWWINPHVDIMWDVTNFWAPYKESKVFRFIPFVGLDQHQEQQAAEKKRVTRLILIALANWR